jgi:hypothetical protein
MHYVTKISHRMQKHNFNVTCTDTLLMETALVPPKQEKYCIDVSRPRRTAMDYVTCRFQQVQKHKFGVTYLDAFFLEPVPVPP